MIKFIVLGVQRTGTTLIRTTLDDHPEITCAGESFKVKRLRAKPYMGEFSYQKYLDEKRCGMIKARLKRSSLVEDFLDRVYSCPGEGAVGFKFMADQSKRFPEVVSYVQKRQIRVIHVVRRNTLKTWVSTLTAKARGGFHSSGERGKESVKVHVPISGLIRKLNSIHQSSERWNEIFAAGPHYLQVAYEDFVGNREREVCRLCDFLEVAGYPAESSLVKLTSDDLSEVITNFDQVKAELEGTPFEWCAT